MGSDLDQLLDRKLLFISGKGGVGKTTASLALGLLASRQGKKTLIAEINSEEQIAVLTGRPPIGYQETELLPGLFGINILPKKSFEEYVLMQIKFQKLYRAVFENRLMRHFIEAVPGLADLMSIGKVYDLVGRYDLVIVDAPSSGHSVAMLEIPGIVARAVRIGPLKSEAEKIDRMLHDDIHTQVLLVTLPEEMPVAETVETAARIRKGLGLSLGPTILNQTFEKIFTAEEERSLNEWARSPRQEARLPLLRAVALQQNRAKMSREYAERLREELKTELLKLPFVYTEDFGLPEVERLAVFMNEGAPR